MHADECGQWVEGYAFMSMATPDLARWPDASKEECVEHCRKTPTCNAVTHHARLCRAHNLPEHGAYPEHAIGGNGSAVRRMCPAGVSNNIPFWCCNPKAEVELEP